MRTLFQLLFRRGRFGIWGVLAPIAWRRREQIIQVLSRVLGRFGYTLPESVQRMARTDANRTGRNRAA